MHPRERVASAHGRTEGLAAAAELISAGQVRSLASSIAQPSPQLGCHYIQRCKSCES
jgi:hypothetical protein